MRVVGSSERGSRLDELEFKKRRAHQPPPPTSSLTQSTHHHLIHTTTKLTDNTNKVFCSPAGDCLNIP